MKYAADFRKIARDALRGNWPLAVLTGFVASLIGATLATDNSLGNFGSSNSSNQSTTDFLSSEILEEFAPILLVASSVLIVWAVATIIISGAGKLGYAKFNLNLADQKPASFSDLFSQFDRLGAGFCMNFLVALYTSLWSLLFIIPGIVKAYSYSMTPYLLAEHPEMTANEAITESRRIMQGNKGRLFCLELSFIGWDLLCLLPVLLFAPLYALGNGSKILWIILCLGSIIVASLFVNPYKEAAHAAFYRDVSSTNL